MNTLTWIIIAIIVAGYLADTILTILNLKYVKKQLPDEVADIYDKEKYTKSQNYKKENTRFSLITSTFYTLLTIALILTGGFAKIDALAQSMSNNPVIVSLIFFGILLTGYTLLNIPFSLYDTFVIEEKYGFNKTTIKTFVGDLIKGYLLGIIIGGILLGAIAWFYYKTGQNFWLYAWALTSFFMIFFSMFYSNLIVPLFNKQTPLPDGELKQAIQDFAQKVGFKIKDIYQIDSSKRSTKLNAYFTGLGSKKRIVLYDTLIEKLTTEEIVAVLAHEIGHYKHKHTLKGIIKSVAITGFEFYLFSLLVDSPQLAQALGVQQPNFHIGLLAFAMLYSPVETLLGLIGNIFSRKHEYQADKFAAENYSGEALINALKKLTSENLSNLTPHPAYVFVYYSHPPLIERIKVIREQ